LARGIVGLFSCMDGPSGVAMLQALYKPEERGRVVGLQAIMYTLGPSAGVLIGGSVIQYASWRWIFLGPMPLIVSFYAMATRVLPKDTIAQAPSWKNFDFVGTLFVALILGSFVMGMNRGNAWGWRSPEILACFAVTLFFIPPLAFQQHRRTGTKVIAPTVYSNMVVLVSFVGIIVFSIGYMGAFIGLPLFLDKIQHFSPVGVSSALFLRPLCVGSISLVLGLKSTQAQPYLSRFTCVGSILLLCAYTCFALMDNGVIPVTVLAVLGLVFQGVGQGLFITPTMTIVSQSVEEDVLANVNGTLMVFFSVGATVGMALFLAVLDSFGDHDDAHAYHNCFRLTVALMSLACPLPFVLHYVPRTSAAAHNPQLKTRRARGVDDSATEMTARDAKGQGVTEPTDQDPQPEKETDQGEGDKVGLLQAAAPEGEQV